MPDIKTITKSSCYGHPCRFARKRIRNFGVGQISKVPLYIILKYRTRFSSKLEWISDLGNRDNLSLGARTWCEDELSDITRYCIGEEQFRRYKNGLFKDLRLH